MNHILVVDDEAEIRSSLEEILREEGYGVAGAADAGEAMVLLRDTPYDVVLLKEMQEGLNTNLAWRMPLGMVLRKITLKRSIGIRKLPSKDMQRLNTDLA